MKYPIAIEWGDETTAIGIHIPDLDIATAGDTYEKAYEAAVEVAHIALQDFVDQGQNIPFPTTVSNHQHKDDYKGMGWGLIDVDVASYLGSSEKISVTMPKRVIASIDEYVKTHNIKSRSTFLTEVSAEKLSHAQ